ASCRYFTVYGERGKEDHAVMAMIARAFIRQDPFIVWGNGTQIRNWTYVGDIVDGLLRAGALPEAVGQAMNLASGRETHIIDMANMVNELTANQGGIKYIERLRWDTKDRLLASIDLARSLLGYEPKMPFREGLERNVKWFRDNWDIIRQSAGD
ncbi:MAG: NAD-dependent epimerase/dehydratase family protein, partial [Planctomycetes bacterium]|nr:NAD-dependent epimerase/dehydratase family protein [Planctomycetota bacterium]